MRVEQDQELHLLVSDLKTQVTDMEMQAKCGGQLRAKSMVLASQRYKYHGPRETTHGVQT